MENGLQYYNVRSCLLALSHYCKWAIKWFIIVTTLVEKVHVLYVGTLSEYCTGLSSTPSLVKPGRQVCSGIYVSACNLFARPAAAQQPDRAAAGTKIWPHERSSDTAAIGFTITKKAPTRAFSWLKAPTSAFTFKTLLRHYAKRALTPR